MTSVTITIPSPILSLSPAEFFDYEIKDSSDSIVDSGTATNAAFTVSGLSCGDFRLFATLDGSTSVWCFTIGCCECPVFSGAVVTQTPAFLYYLDVSFDLTGGFPPCPFNILIDEGTPAERIIPILSIGSFTSNVGDIYTKSILLSRDSCRYSIVRSDGVICKPVTNIGFDCEAPDFPTVGGIVPTGPVHTITGVLVQITPGNWVFRMVFPDCGITCHVMSVRLAQYYTLPGWTPDASFTNIVIDCSWSFPYTYDLPIHPVPYIPSIPLTYGFQMTNCCSGGLPTTYFAQE